MADFIPILACRQQWLWPEHRPQRSVRRFAGHSRDVPHLRIEGQRHRHMLGCVHCANLCSALSAGGLFPWGLQVYPNRHLPSCVAGVVAVGPSLDYHLDSQWWPLSSRYKPNRPERCAKRPDWCSPSGRRTLPHLRLEELRDRPVLGCAFLCQRWCHRCDVCWNACRHGQCSWPPSLQHLLPLCKCRRRQLWSVHPSQRPVGGCPGGDRNAPHLRLEERRYRCMLGCVPAGPR